MACVGRYAESIDFASSFCVERFLSGLDMGAGVGHATITTNVWDWIQYHVAVGSPVYNVATATYGKVTNVAQYVLQVSGVTFSNGDAFLVLPISANETATIEHFLNIAAGAIHVVRQSQGACDCTLSEGAKQFLRDLNCVIAAVRHNCACGGAKLDQQIRQALLEDANEKLKLIRTGEIELCEGYTGKDYPAFGAVELGWTPGAEAEIIYNRIRRGGGLF